MIKKQMTEARAWRIVAEEMDADRTSGFICNAVRSAYNDRISTISEELRDNMVSRVEAMLDDDSRPAYGTEIGWNEAHEARVIACLMFAEISRLE